jgi:hypothetical protein
MASDSQRRSDELVPLRGSEDRPEVERPSGWDPKETVPVRAGGESKEAVERAERLRLVSGRRRALRDL